MFDDLTAEEKETLRVSLSRAIASGQQSVTYSSGGTTRSITYRSVAEMEATLRALGAGDSFAESYQTARTTRGT